MSLTHPGTSGLDLLQLGKGELCLDNTNTGTPDPPRMDSELKLLTMTHGFPFLGFTVPAFQHSAVTSTLGRVRIWYTNPKDTEGIFKGKPNQIISSNPKESDLPHHVLSRSKITKLDHFPYLRRNCFLFIRAQISMLLLLLLQDE